MAEVYQNQKQQANQSPYHGLSTEECIAMEKQAVNAVKLFAKCNQNYLRILWHWGDGGGGGIMNIIADEIGEMTANEKTRLRPKPSYTKAVIPAALRTQVFERDAYRCLHCGTHKTLTCDHITPESKGGATTLDNLQTLCKSCNSKKGVKA